MSRLAPTRATVLTVLALVPLAIASRANDAIPTAAAGGVTRAPHVLVLPGGRAITGDIQLSQNGYEVSIGPNTGRVFVSKEMVWFTADSLPAAYEELKKRFPDHTADGYVELANWCLEHSLYDQAEANLKSALQLDPKHAAARVTAKELGKLLSQRPQQPSATTSAASASSAGTAMSRTATSEKEITRQFVSRIQPILVNGCGNASCHGRSSNSPFRLKNVRPGHPSFKSFTESNREMLERMITNDRPENSPLLTVPRDARHSALRQPLFAGRAGAEQWQSLVAWVNAVAASRDSESRGSERQSTSAAPIAAQQTIQTVAGTTESPIDTTQATPVVPRSANAMDESSIQTVLRQAMTSGEPDAFDPRDFNRRFARQADLSTTPISNGPTR